MTRNLSQFIAAGLGALALASGAAVYADDAPLSANESGAISAQHSLAAPTAASGEVGRSPSAAYGEVRGSQRSDASGSGIFEVQTPSSVSESAPWLTDR